MAKTKNERSNRHNLYLTVTDVERKPVARNIQSTQVPPSDVLPHPDEDKWTSLPSHGQTRAKFFWLYDPFVEDAFVEPDMFQIQVSADSLHSGMLSCGCAKPST